MPVIGRFAASGAVCGVGRVIVCVSSFDDLRGVYGVFLPDYLYLDERAVHTRQQYAGMGTATDAPESAPLLRRSDAYGLSEG